MEPTIFDDLQALSGSMKIATGCIDILLKHDTCILMPLDLDHIDTHLVELKTCLERVERHIIIQQVVYERSK